MKIDNITTLLCKAQNQADKIQKEVNELLQLLLQEFRELQIDKEEDDFCTDEYKERQKDNEDSLWIEKYRVLKYSFGDCVIIGTGRSKVQGMMVDGLLPKNASFLGKEGIVVGTTAHFVVDILVVDDNLCIRKKNTSVTPITK